MAGGMDWLRWHHGSTTDPKFALVAKRAGVRLPDVLAVWAHLLEAASQADERGRFGSIDCEAVDLLFGLDDGGTAGILSEMDARGLTSDGWISAWAKRQPKREREDDSSTERVRAYRQRQRESAGVSDDETPCNTTQRHETPRGEESRGDISPSLRSGDTRKRASAPSRPSDVDESTWADWLALRKAKRAPVTTTVVREAEREAGKAGIPLGRFLEIWCARGSQGLQAEWLRPDERARAGPAPIQQQSKTLTAIQKLQALKTDERDVDPQRNHGRAEPVALLGA